jgi:hypothetical protein
MRPIILFCNSVLTPQKPDEMFLAEFTSARQAGFETALFSDNRLIAGDIQGSLKTIPRREDPTPVI